jgi:hypothetical protein
MVILVTVNAVTPSVFRKVKTNTGTALELCGATVFGELAGVCNTGAATAGIANTAKKKNSSALNRFRCMMGKYINEMGIRLRVMLG